MELLQLKYFQTVAKLEHVTQAAGELHIAQPALSKTIALLEADLGVKLFDRSGKYIKLNAYGKAFLKRVEIALSSLEDGKRELKDMTNETFGDIKLAILAGSNIITELLTSFRKIHPHINFQLVQHYQNNLNALDYDLCISSLPVALKNISSIPLFTEEIFLAVPNSHPFANRESIDLYEAANENFISLRTGTVLREVTDLLCHSAGFSPHIIFESDDPTTVRGLIRAGVGVAFVPEISWGGSTGASVVLINIKAPECKRTLAIISREDRYLPSAAKLFREFTVSYFCKEKNPDTSKLSLP